MGRVSRSQDFPALHGPNIPQSCGSSRPAQKRCSTPSDSKASCTSQVEHFELLEKKTRSSKDHMRIIIIRQIEAVTKEDLKNVYESLPSVFQVSSTMSPKRLLYQGEAERVCSQSQQQWPQL